MSLEKRLTVDERAQIEALIQAFDNHGCGLGLDIQTQAAMRRLSVPWTRPSELWSNSES